TSRPTSETGAGETDAGAPSDALAVSLFAAPEAALVSDGGGDVGLETKNCSMKKATTPDKIRTAAERLSVWRTDPRGRDDFACCLGEKLAGCGGGGESNEGAGLWLGDAASSSLLTDSSVPTKGMTSSGKKAALPLPFAGTAATVLGRAQS